MKIYLNKQLKNNENILIQNVKNQKTFETVNSNKLNSLSSSAIFLDKRKDNYIQKYDYGKNIQGKNEYVIRWGKGCVYNCAYCFPKARFKKNKLITIFPEIDKIVEEITLLKKKLPTDQILKLHAGENFDSFIFENIIPFSETLSTEAGQNFSNINIEYRTKSLVPDSFIKNACKKNSTIAFSLSPENVQKKYEKKVPPLSLKLENIIKLQKEDFKVALSFEPVILTENYLNNYKKLFLKLFNNNILDKVENIDISLLRLTHENYKTLLNNHPELLNHEWVYNKVNKKYRYFIPIRKKAYKNIIKLLSQYYSGRIFLSTEYKWLK
ncbi:MAG: spore photoproduct lyase family protein [Candidatus Muiribacteriota bacterium]